MLSGPAGGGGGGGGGGGLRGAAGAGGRRARRAALHGDARVVGVGLAARRLVQDGLGQLVEGAVDVDVGLGRRLHEPDAVLARYLRTATEHRLSIPIKLLLKCTYML